MIRPTSTMIEFMDLESIKDLLIQYQNEMAEMVEVIREITTHSMIDDQSYYEAYLIDPLSHIIMGGGNPYDAKLADLIKAVHLGIVGHEDACECPECSQEF